VHRTGRVGRDELEVEVLPGEHLGAPVALTGGDGLDGDLPEDPCARVMLRKPGPATSTVSTPGRRRSSAASSSATSRGGRPAGLARRSATFVRVVAVLGVLRPLDDDVARYVDGSSPRSTTAATAVRTTSCSCSGVTARAY
jgi:hypothetical protein